MNRYRLAPAARDDLTRIAWYVANERQSPHGAKRLRELLLDDFRRLARNPLMGAACPDFGFDLRIWPVGNYVILCRPTELGIDVVQIAHGAQGLPNVVRPTAAHPRRIT